MQPDSSESGSTAEGTSSVQPVSLKMNPLEISYESERQRLKLGTLMSAYLMFQSTVGISLFTLQQPFNQAGLIWSFFITCLCCYITTYGLLTILRLVRQIELDHKVEKRFQNLYSTTAYLKGPHIGVMRWLMTIACVGMMLTSSVSNLMLTTQSLKESVGKNLATFTIWFAISVVLVVFVEPEKIKVFTTTTTLIVMLVAAVFTALNLRKFFLGHSLVSLDQIPLFNFSNTFLLTGNLIYAFELCSCYLSLRLTSAEHVNYDGLTKKMMVFITVVYFIVGASFSLAYPPDKIDESAFEIYKHGLFRWFTVAYMVNTVYNFLTNTIFACEVFESIAWVRRLLVDQNDSLQRKNLVVLRLAMWTLTVLISLVSGDQVTSFLNFSGSVFSPVVGFIGPLVYFYTYKSNRKEQVLPARKIHDLVYLCVCLWISYKGLTAVF